MLDRSEWLRYRIQDDHAIFGDDYYMLSDNETLRECDETGCVSTLLSLDCHEGWTPVMPVWKKEIGKKIADIVSDDSVDADVSERVFRRRYK